MRLNSHRNKFISHHENILERSAGDTQTYVRENKYRMPTNVSRTPHSSNQFERQNHFSSTKHVNSKYDSKPITGLKNELYNLKNDFSNYLNDDSQKYEGLLFKKYSGQKSPIYDDDQFQSPVKYSPRVTNSVQIIEEQNISLKAQLKRFHLRYQTKKHEYKEAVKFLNKKIEYLEEQLIVNEQDMMQCKLQLQGQMQMIRQQLAKKKDAQISLDDYGELVQINSNLKEQINCHIASIEQMKTSLQNQFRKYAELQRHNNLITGNKKDLQNKAKQYISKQAILHQQKQKLSVSNQILTNQIKQLQNSSLSAQQSFKNSFQIIESLKQQIIHLQTQKGELQQQNNGLRNRELDYLKNIGDLNSQCLQLNNNFEQYRKHQQVNSIDSNPQIQFLKEENRRQRQEMENMIATIRQLEQIKYRLETERGAMLNDIIFIERELEKRHIEGNELRIIISERQNQIMLLRGVIQNFEQQKRQQSTAQKSHNESIFVQSAKISQQVTKDFENLLNSPKLLHERKNVTFEMIPEIPSSDLNNPINNNNFLVQQQPNPQAQQNILRNYLTTLNDNNELAISIIVSQTQLHQQNSIKDQSLLIDNGSGLSSTSHNSLVVEMPVDL